MTRFLRTLLMVVGLMSCLGDAEAQTYVRPSKGKAFTITLAKGASSATYDWTAFESLQLRAVAHTCLSGGEIQVYGGDVPGVIDKSSATIVSDPNATTVIANDEAITTTLSNLPSYVAFYVATSGVACNVTLTVTPLPFNFRHAVSGAASVTYDGTAGSTTKQAPVLVGGIETANGGPIPITTSDGVGASSAPLHALHVANMPILATQHQAAIVAVSTNCTSTAVVTQFASIQNLSTATVYCGTNASCTNTPTLISAALKAGAANNDGTGGSVVFSNVAGTIYCVSSSGTANVAVGGY